MSPAGKALSAALESTGDWTAGSNAIKHRPSGLSFWVANGPGFFDGNDIAGTPLCLGFFERYWLYYKARKVRSAYVRPDPNAEVAQAFEAAAK